jgi:hypothetical protein
MASTRHVMGCHVTQKWPPVRFFPSTSPTLHTQSRISETTSSAMPAAVIIACVALLPQRAGLHPDKDQPSVGGLQARRRNPVIYLCVGLEQLNFLKKFISLWTRRHAVSFTRALLRHTYIINLFHVVSPRKQRPHFSGRLKVMRLHSMRIENETRNKHGGDGQHPLKHFRGRPLGD